MTKSLSNRLLSRMLRVSFNPSISMLRPRLDNGILTDLSAKVVRKMVGFTPMTVHLQNGDMLSVLAKSKALDSEIIKGIHYMASQIDTTLADKILATANYLEYRDCHLKEIEVFRFLDKRQFNHMPRFYGSKIDERTRGLSTF